MHWRHTQTTFFLLDISIITPPHSCVCKHMRWICWKKKNFIQWWNHLQFISWHLLWIPQEQQPDNTRTHNSFNPLPFAYFLKFLCFYHLQDIPSCRQSLQRLEQVQWILSHCGTKVFIPETLNTLMLCGIARQLMGDIFIARKPL